MDISFDEAFSFFVAKQNLENLLSAILYDNHPPFYFLFLHFWTRLFGENELAIRIPSMVAGFSSIVIFYLLLKELFNKSLSIKGSILFALLPSLIYFSTQVRMYSLLLFLSLTATYFWLKLLKRFDIKRAILFIVVFFLTISTHYYGYLLVIPYFLLAVKQKVRLKFLLVLFTPLLLSFPWVYLYLTSQHPGTFIQNSLVAVPFVFASFIVNPVILIKMFTSEDVIMAKLLLLSILALSVVIFLRGIRVIKGKKIISYFILLFSPLVFLFFANLFIPVFSVRPAVMLNPYFLVILLFGLTAFPEKFSHKIYLSLISLLILLNITIRVSHDLRDLEIKKALNILSDQSIAYHTSILTYYPFQYYEPQKQNYLVTTNPLSPQTVEIIGGTTERIPANVSDAILVDTKNGADKNELNTLFKNLKRIYRLERTADMGNITIYFYKLPDEPDE